MKTKYGNVDFTDSNGQTDKLITALLLGVAIGACGAILFAPKSGRVIREKIKDMAGKKVNELDKQWENVKEKATDAAGNASDAIESATNKAESKLNQFADKAENEVSDGMETVVDKFQKRY